MCFVLFKMVFHGMCSFIFFCDLASCLFDFVFVFFALTGPFSGFNDHKPHLQLPPSPSAAFSWKSKSQRLRKGKSLTITSTDSSSLW